jgi:hypothetical protein
MRGKNYIYKFCPINEFTIKNLILSQMWFGPPNLMNDQLEGLVKIKNVNFKPSNKAINNFIRINSLHNFYFEPERKIEEQGFVKFYMSHWFRFERTRYAISCFASNPKESLMWAHYANKHSGLCLVYDRELLLESLRVYHHEFKSTSIKYGVRPTITLIEKNGSIEYSSDLPIISTKNSNWKYEKETRFYLKNDRNENSPGQTIFIQNSVLKGIIYGYQISEEDQDTISLIIRNEPLYSHVKEYSANIDYEKGDIYFELD